MKRTFLFLLAVTFLSMSSFAQSVIYQDDFESYTVGAYLAEQAPEWTTWSGAPGSDEDAMISDDYAQSGSNSVLVQDLTDLVLPLGDKQNGVFNISFSYYVETGYGGYFNLQHYEAAGTEWAVEVFFGSDGSGEVKTDNVITEFTYTVASWTDIETEIDLDNDEAMIWIDGNLIHTWVWSTQAGGGAGANQLGGLNIWAGALGTDDPMFYFDDIEVVQIFAPLYEDDFESYTSGDYIAVENPEWWETWSNLPGTAEDGLILSEQAYSGDNSVKVDGTTDLIFLLGDKSAGEFEVNWMYYVPSGFAGYYNFQHYMAPGTEWAIEVYFNDDGTGEFKADGATINFTFDHDTWLEIDHNISLDDDMAEMYLNGTMIHSWVWNTQATGGAGANQLGSVNFFAGANTGQTPTYYIDDVFYMQTGGATDPGIELLPIMLDDTVGTGATADRNLNVSNIGGADLTYMISVVYDIPTKKTVEIPVVESYRFAKGNAEFSMNIGEAGGSPEPTDDVELHYDSENIGNSVGLTNPGEWRGAAKFPAAMVNQYAGMELSEVKVFLATPDLGDDISVQIYGMGLDYVPGDLITEQFFTSIVQTDWNYMTLDNPVAITGEDIWVSIYINQTQIETFPLGIDGDPAGYNINGDWFSTGPGWGHVTDNPDIDGNWNIRATLTGDPIEGWLSADPTSGMISAGDFEDITVTYDASNLVVGTYTAKLVFVSNDPENQMLDLPVTLTVVDGTGIGDDEVSRIEMLVYPNPARNVVNVQSNLNIDRLSIYNHIGQVVTEVPVNNSTASVNIDGIDAGVYIIRIETANGFTTQKLVIE